MRYSRRSAAGNRRRKAIFVFMGLVFLCPTGTARTAAIGSVFGPESTVVPLVVRFVSSLFFSLYERLWRGATVVAETVWRSRSTRPCFPLIRFDGNRRSTVRPVALPGRFGRTVARAFRPSLSVPGTCFF